MADKITTTITDNCTSAHAWECAMQRYIDAKEAAKIEAEDNAERALIRMPAPSMAALRWKLDQLLAGERDDFCAAWSVDYLVQTKADIARLMA